MGDAYDEMNALADAGIEEGTELNFGPGSEVWVAGKELEGHYVVAEITIGNFGACARVKGRDSGSAPADQILNAVRSGAAYLSESYGFDKFMDDIIEREEAETKKRAKLLEESKEDTWGRKRAMAHQEIPGNRIKYNG